MRPKKPKRQFRTTLPRVFVLAAVVCMTAAAFDRSDLRGQPDLAPSRPIPAADQLHIVVESVSGTVYYTRNDQRYSVTTDSELSQGDRIHANPGAVCKLEFQRPKTAEVLSATIIRGYSDVAISRAFQQGQETNTVLDVRQGVIRAGVVRTAVPPSFRVRTPRTVVAIRGTEIAEFEVSNDFGDSLKMGVVGSVMVNDSVPLFRSVQAEQGIKKRTEHDRRGSRLLRAIEVAVLKRQQNYAGPHRRGFEVDFARRNLLSLPIESNSSDTYKREGNPNRDRMNNARGRFDYLQQLQMIQGPQQQNQVHNPFQIPNPLPIPLPPPFITTMP